MRYRDSYPSEGCRLIDATLLKGGCVVGEMNEIGALGTGKAEVRFWIHAKDTANELAGGYEIEILADEGEGVTSHQHLKGVQVSQRANRFGRHSLSYAERWVCNESKIPSGKRTKRHITPWERID